jgi:hypothetical protein
MHKGDKVKYENLSQNKVLTDEEAVDRITHLLNEFWPDVLSHVTANMVQASMLYGALGVVFYDEHMEHAPVKAKVLLGSIEENVEGVRKALVDFLESVGEIRNLMALNVKIKPDGEQVQ